MPTWLVTGGAGFIGGNFVREAVARGVRVINLDALTYAGNLESLRDLDGNPDHVFVHGDIGDRTLVPRLLAEYRPDAVLNFAAESHVDRSIDGPAAFIQTNVVGTLALLVASTLEPWQIRVDVAATPDDAFVLLDGGAHYCLAVLDRRQPARADRLRRHPLIDPQTMADTVNSRTPSRLRSCFCGSGAGRCARRR